MIYIENKKTQSILMILLAILVLLAVFILIYPSVYEHICKTRHFDEFEEGITTEVLESNIVIVRRLEETNGNVTHVSYSSGASGVIFDSENDTYYALTAYHVVMNCENTDLFVLPYGSPTYSEYSKNNDSYVSYEMYYGQFRNPQLVYFDEECDLAVIKFKSNKKMNVLSICEKNPQYKERIAVISNPMGERFLCTYGTINSKKYYIFNSNDGLLPVNTYKHSAYENYGSSGSAVLNSEMQIVGINIGGGTDFMQRFKFGAMVPCEMICEFLEKSSLK